MTALAIALIGGGGIALVAFNQNRSSPVIPAEASVSPTVSPGTESGESVYDSTNKSRTPANANRTSSETKRTIVVPANDRDRILVDVPDNKIDHAELEGFIEKRPMDAYRIVHVDSDALRAVIRQVDQQPSFELQLLSATPVTLVAKDAEEYSSGWQSGIASWRGRVAGDKYSYAMFVVAPDGSVHGKINWRDSRRIAIDPIPNTPYHIVWRWKKGFERSID